MTRAKRVGAAVLSAALVLVGCSATTTQPRSHTGRLGTGSGPAPASHIPGSPPPGTPVAATSATSTPAPPPRDPRLVARAAMMRLERRLPADAISVAVRDEDTGASYFYGARSGMWTGSVYKLLVLEALLLERQEDGDWFSSGELADITAMIEHSDNAAGYRMFLDAGGSTALAATARRLGMRHTRIGVSDPTFTTTSAYDGLAMLRCLVEPGLLDRHSRLFVLSLMHAVESDQRWGVGVLADRGTTFANKNGWLSVDDTNGPGEDDDGRWVVSSVGIVRVHGERLLVSIFTKHNPDFDDGVRLVERLARLAAPAVLPAS
jgi:beta-lactamase class A